MITIYFCFLHHKSKQSPKVAEITKQPLCIDIRNCRCIFYLYATERRRANGLHFLSNALFYLLCGCVNVLIFLLLRELQLC